MTSEALDAARDDDGRARRPERLARDEVVARDLVAELLAHVERTRRRQVGDVEHVRVPEDHDLDGGEVRDLDLVGVHVGTALHHRVRVAPAARRSIGGSMPSHAATPAARPARRTGWRRRERRCAAAAPTAPRTGSQPANGLRRGGGAAANGFAPRERIRAAAQPRRRRGRRSAATGRGGPPRRRVTDGGGSAVAGSRVLEHESASSRSESDRPGESCTC